MRYICLIWSTPAAYMLPGAASDRGHGHRAEVYKAVPCIVVFRSREDTRYILVVCVKNNGRPVDTNGN